MRIKIQFKDAESYDKVREHVIRFCNNYVGNDNRLLMVIDDPPELILRYSQDVGASIVEDKQHNPDKPLWVWMTQEEEKPSEAEITYHEAMEFLSRNETEPENPLPVIAPSITYASDESFANDIAKGLVLVDFWAPWCGPCRLMSSMIDDIAKETSGFCKIVKVNVDECPTVMADLCIRSIPKLVLYRNGVELDSIVGVCSRSYISNWLNSKK